MVPKDQKDAKNEDAWKVTAKPPDSGDSAATQLAASLKTVEVTGKIASLFIVLMLIINSYALLMPWYWFAGESMLETASSWETIESLVLLVGAIAFLVWFWKAYKNISLLGIKAKWSPVWTVLAFIAPLVNFYLPYGLMKEVVIKSCQKAEIADNDRKLVIYWWATTLVYTISNYFLGGLPLVLMESSLAAAIIAGVLSDLTYFASGVLIVILIKRITTTQKLAAKKHLQEILFPQEEPAES